MNLFRKFRFYLRRRELRRLGITHDTDSNGAFVRGPGGWKVQQGCDHPADPIVFYHEGDRSLCLDACYWHESKEDRLADTSDMSIKELLRYYDRRIFRIYISDDLRWRAPKKNSPTGWSYSDIGEIVSPSDRERIMNNIELAYEYQGIKPYFVK